MPIPRTDRLYPKDNKNKEDTDVLGAAARRELTSLLTAIFELSSRQWMEQHLLCLEEGLGLHLGCGGGENTFLIASLLGKKAVVYGIDEDPALIETARQKKALSGPEHVHFAQASLYLWKVDTMYDFIYTRIQTAAAPNPEKWPIGLARNLQTGGVLLAEILSPSGFRAYPYNHAFARAMELIGRLEEAQPYGAEQLPGLLRPAGFAAIKTTYASPAFIPPACNRIASLSLECYRAEILRRGDSNREELNALLQELRAYEQQEDTLVSRPGVLQVWAKKD